MILEIMSLISIICLILAIISMFIALTLFGVMCRGGPETGRIFFILSIILFIIGIATGSFSVLQFLGVI